jgi:hypothetical protein
MQREAAPGTSPARLFLCREERRRTSRRAACLNQRLRLREERGTCMQLSVMVAEQRG